MHSNWHLLHSVILFHYPIVAFTSFAYVSPIPLVLWSLYIFAILTALNLLQKSGAEQRERGKRERERASNKQANIANT